MNLRRTVVALVGVALVVAAVATTGCSSSPDGDTVTVDSTTTTLSSPAPDADSPAPGSGESGGVATLADVPLSARANALGLWTGSEVLVIGGDPEPWCPPDADCTAPEFQSLSDGVALNPETVVWRPLSDAPVPVTRYAGSVMLVEAGELYVLTRPVFTDRGRSQPSFLRYNVKADSWAELPLPPGADDAWPALIEVDGSVMAYHTSDENGETPDHWFDADSNTWIELPADPLSPSYDRLYVATGSDLLLLAKDIDDVGADGPSFARMARLDLAANTWSEEGWAEVLWSDFAVAIGDRLVFPYGGSSDGGQVNGWGRDVPHGGIHHLGTGQWEPLPPPAVEDSLRIGGVIGDGEAHIWSADDVVLDLDTNRWLQVPLPEIDGGVTVQRRTVVGTGSGVFVFGGELWNEDGGRVLGDAQLFTFG